MSMVMEQRRSGHLSFRCKNTNEIARSIEDYYDNNYSINTLTFSNFEVQSKRSREEVDFLKITIIQRNTQLCNGRKGCGHVMSCDVITLEGLFCLIQFVHPMLSFFTHSLQYMTVLTSTVHLSHQVTHPFCVCGGRVCVCVVGGQQIRGGTTSACHPRVFNTHSEL